MQVHENKQCNSVWFTMAGFIAQLLKECAYGTANTSRDHNMPSLLLLGSISITDWLQQMIWGDINQSQICTQAWPRETCWNQYKISHRKMTDVSAIQDRCRLELHQNIYPTYSHGLQTMTQSSGETNSLEQCNSPISSYVDKKWLFGHGHVCQFRTFNNK